MSAPLAMLAAFLLALPSAAPQNKLKQAQGFFLEGVEAGKHDHWKDALEKFRRSQDLVDRPSTAFNIGSALMHLEQYQDAIEAFEHFLILADQDKDAELCRQARELEAEAKKTIAAREQPARPEPQAEVKEEPVPESRPVAERPSVEPEKPLPLATREEPPKIRVEAEGKQESGGGILSSPVFWIIAGVVVVGAAVATGVALSSGGERSPYPGSSNTVLRGLRW